MASMAQRAGSFGVEAIFNEEGNSDNPFCEHGPSLLFERFYGEGVSRKFYACSACRDRKQCPFFQWQDDKITEGKNIHQKEIMNLLLKEQKETTQLLVANDNWCSTCNLGFKTKNEKQHDEHSSIELTAENLASPSLILSPKESNKANAQYFFDKESSNFLMKMISKLNYERVVCVGTPVLFELLQKKGIRSILLDIDGRYGQFFPSETCLRYNMFNNYFFNTTNGEQTLRDFICDGDAEKVLLVVDPPFGGLINVLAKTFERIWEFGPCETLDTFLIFPYFLESHVLQSLPKFKMLDYKVGYTNHAQYNNTNKKNSRGSPVRIFTNVQLNKIDLPKDKYRLCKTCEKYVYKENVHCKICKDCPSKDGRTYVHCADCEKCVKPGRLHCTECKQCLPPNHKCSENLKSSVCHICGGDDHKRRDCPQRKKDSSQSNENVNNKKKKSNKRKMNPKKIKTTLKKTKV